MTLALTGNDLILDQIGFCRASVPLGTVHDERSHHNQISAGGRLTGK